MNIFKELLLEKFNDSSLFGFDQLPCKKEVIERESRFVSPSIAESWWKSRKKQIELMEKTYTFHPVEAKVVDSALYTKCHTDCFLAFNIMDYKWASHLHTFGTIFMGGMPPYLFTKKEGRETIRFLPTKNESHALHMLSRLTDVYGYETSLKRVGDGIWEVSIKGGGTSTTFKSGKVCEAVCGCCLNLIRESLKEKLK